MTWIKSNIFLHNVSTGILISKRFQDIPVCGVEHYAREGVCGLELDAERDLFVRHETGRVRVQTETDRIRHHSHRHGYVVALF